MSKHKSASNPPVAKADAGEPAKKKRSNPFQFIQEVRREGSKVTWTTRSETIVSTVMVLIMVFLMALFFWIVDQFFIVTVVCSLLRSGSCPYDLPWISDDLTTGF